jgi:hypothetical protein
MTRQIEGKKSVPIADKIVSVVDRFGASAINYEQKKVNYFLELQKKEKGGMKFIQITKPEVTNNGEKENKEV